MAEFHTQVADTKVVVYYVEETKEIIDIATDDSERRAIHVASEEREKLMRLLPTMERDNGV